MKSAIYHIINISILLFYHWAASGQIPASNPEKLLFVVNFQDNFQHDTVSLTINNCVVAESLILSSDESLGFANFSLVAYNYGGTTMLTRGINTIVCSLKRKIKFVVELNRTNFVFNVDLKHGKYVGFYKDVDRTIKLLQSKRQFAYR